MKRKTRTILFFSFLLLFALFAPIIIVYSQGYRIDWDQKNIVQTGALYFEPRPAPVEVFVDGILEKRSNFVFQNIFIGNLLPKTYTVEIKKEGYSTWSKNLTVSPKLVTEVKNSILFPVNSNAVPIADSVRNFSFSPNKKNIALVKDDPIPTITNYAVEKATEKLIFKAAANKAGATISDIQWNRDSSKLLFALKSATHKKWIVVDLESLPPTTLSLSEKIAVDKNFLRQTTQLYKPSIERVSWSNSESSTLFMTIREFNNLPTKPKLGLLFAYSLKDEKMSDPFAFDVLEYMQNDNSVFYVSSLMGTLHHLNLKTRQTKQLSFNPLNYAPNGEIQLIGASGGKIIALAGNAPRGSGLQDVYLYSRESNSFKKIAGGVRSVRLSGDDKKILLRTQNTIRVYWLEQTHTQPFRDAQDNRLLYASDAGVILDARWFTKSNEHILFSTENGVYVIELDGRDTHNMHMLSKRSSKNIYYEANLGNLYILSNRSVVSLPIN